MIFTVNPSVRLPPVSQAAVGKVILAALALIVTGGSSRAQPANLTPAASPAPASSPDSRSAEAKGLGRNFVVPAEKTQPVRITRFEKPPVVDGKLDDEVWKSAVILTDFYDIDPGDSACH